MKKKPVRSRPKVKTRQTAQVTDVHVDQVVMPYDETLLERARTQWQFGDWQSLAGMERDDLQHHPQRAKLALLVAAAHLQLNDSAAARQLIRLAEDWGCSKRLISQILVGGVYNSLGRASAIASQERRALKHFESAISIGTPEAELRLLVHARVGEQLSQLGLSYDNSALRLTVAQNPKAFDEQSTIVNKPPGAIAQRLKDEIKSDINAELKASNPNPYVHNRTLTSSLNKSLREFAERDLKCAGLKTTYIDYLAAKAIQIERNCVGRLATTVQDAIARQLILECVPGEQLCILEIGALYGISLAILYNHAITRYRKVQVVCLDPFDGYYGKVVDAVLNSPVNDLTFLRNMRLANVPEADYSLIKHYSTDPAALAAAAQLPINLLIIDGDHSHEGIKFDFDNYFPLLQPGGYVIFDDYNAKDWPGVQQFIDQDVRKTPEFEYVGAISRTAVGRKKSSKQ